MSQDFKQPLVAVDIGNSRLKFGLFLGEQRGALPEPVRTMRLPTGEMDFSAVQVWLEQPAREVQWLLASVNRPSATQLVDWLRDQQAEHQTRMLTSLDLPLQVLLARPDMVGIDRLAGAVAANQLRTAGKAAVILDLGTAITVDVVNEDGAFLGGAILPGIGMSARAMHEFTDLLPLLDMEALVAAPTAIGTATLEAMQSGLFWGAIGAAKELVAQFSLALSSEPEVFVTGGAAASTAALISADATHSPNLVLGGIAVAAAKVFGAESRAQRSS